MDTLHSMMRTLQGDTKSSPQHLTVFREFLKHLGTIQHKAPQKPAAKVTRAKSPRVKSPHAKPAPRRKPAKRTRMG